MKRFLDTNLLETKNIVVKFGGLVALNNISITANKGEIKGIVGPNGAGKTTLFNAICGHIPLKSGEIFFNNKKISNLETHEIAKIGIIRTFQKRGLIPHLTVLENVLLGCHRLIGNINILDIVFRLTNFRSIERISINRAMDALEMLGLQDISDKYTSELSFGQQTLVEIARVLVANPVLLLLDEPAAGLGAAERKNILSILKDLSSKKGVTLLISDHVMDFVMELCQNLVVLNFGKVLIDGSANYVREHKDVIKAYLGEKVK